MYHGVRLSRSIATVVLAIAISVVGFAVLSYYADLTAQAKPGNGKGNGGNTPPPTSSPDTAIQSWVDHDSANPIDEDGSGTETTDITYSATNADGAEYAVDSGAWQTAPASPFSSVVLPADGKEHVLQMRATRSSDGAVDSSPATAKMTMCPQAGCAVAPPPPSTDAVLVGAGDIASCSSTGDEATAKLLDNIPGTVYTTGDNVYLDGTASEFNDCYNPTWGRHKARTKPVPGNHDYNTAGASGYFGYFGSAAGDPSKGYYSYDLGEWHVVVLNSMCENVGGCGATSPMVTWLKNDLAANPKSCTAALWHHPVFSSGYEHGNDPKMQPSWQVLYDAKADVILNGHDHDYERFAPQTPVAAADPTNGIREFVVGSGGASHYGLGTKRANSEVFNGDTYGVLKLTLHSGSYDWQFVPEAGKTFTDSGTTNCH